MSSPRLDIELSPGPLAEAGSPDPWAAGDTVRGWLRVDLPADSRMRGISIELKWQTEGRGTVDECVVGKVSWVETQLPASPPFELPFELHIPANGPVSYHGNLLSIVWTLRANIDIPWAIDVGESREITVLPRGAATH